MKLHLIRHAQTEENSKGSLECDTDAPLNSDGLQQAVKLSKYLTLLTFNKIWCSPLTRARQTLNPFIKYVQIEPLYSPLLSEGQLNLDPSAPVSTPTLSPQTGLPVVAESIGSFRGRVTAVLSMARALDADATILCITHGHFIRETLNIFLNAANYTRFPIGNCSDTLIEFGKDPIIHYVNRETIWL